MDEFVWEGVWYGHDVNWLSFLHELFICVMLALIPCGRVWVRIIPGLA